MRNAGVPTILIAVATLTLAIAPGFGQQSVPDLILVNGKIFTSDVRQPYVEALAIRSDRIVAAGASKDILLLATKDTRRIDLAGRTVVPGFNDVHVHLSALSEADRLAIKSQDPKWPEVKEALLAATAKAPKNKRWVVGVVRNAILDGPEATREEIDALCPNHPVVLWDWTFIRSSDGKLTAPVGPFALCHEVEASGGAQKNRPVPISTTELLKPRFD
jgi:hypothetical protein